MKIIQTKGRFWIIAVALTSIAATLSGCSGAQAKQNEKTVVQDIQNRGELRVGVAPAAPHVYKDPSTNEWRGTYVEFTKYWAKTLGVKITFVDTSWDNIVAGLQAGKYDVAAALNATPTRSLAVAFSDPLVSQISAYALNPSKTPVKNWSELNNANYTICVMSGTAQDKAITNLPGVRAKVQRLPDQDSCRLALTSGRINAFLDDWWGHGPFVKANPSLKILFPETELNREGIAFGLPITSSWTDVQAINTAISEWKATGMLDKSMAENNAVDPVQFAMQPVPAYVQNAK